MEALTPAHWPEPAKKRTTRKALPVTPQRTICVACGVAFPRFSAWERHSDATGHHRCQFPLPAPQQEEEAP